MPIYVYKCKKCNTEQEVLRKINEKHPICKNCNIDGLEKQVTSASARFYGSGYYCTDFKNK